ncbi:hypothetical protein RRG08_016138 [Elysia crispata]|uniref:Uncharacterized protein n=1 Tax=Elysia crispata TaxID=231223 RepID=A0AAE0Z3Q3_9GAST|nr:hypothetical protein RRG08_016138 [Elysia crispata]
MSAYGIFSQATGQRRNKVRTFLDLGPRLLSHPQCISHALCPASPRCASFTHDHARAIVTVFAFRTNIADTPQ